MMCTEALIKNDGWDYANGIKKRPEIIEGDSASEVAGRAWDIVDRKAKSDLILSIGPSELKQIKGYQTAYDVWKKLESVYASKGPAKKVALLKRLTAHRISNNDNIREYIDKFIEIIDKLAAMDISKYTKIYKVLCYWIVY